MKSFKVLLVDDEQEFIEALSERLELRDMETRMALDGEEALESVRDEEPDVMVLDLKMPGMDGMEVLRRVRKAFPSVQVVMLTGHGSARDEERARRLGAYAYLQKPVDLESLVDTLRTAHAQLARRFEAGMMAASFAEAGEPASARQMLDRGEDPVGEEKRQQ